MSCFVQSLAISNKVYHFPAHGGITSAIHQSHTLGGAYFAQKGITHAVSRIAEDRFANRRFTENGIKRQVSLMLYDLQEGVDGYTGKLIPCKPEVFHLENFAKVIRLDLEQILKACARECP